MQKRVMVGGAESMQNLESGREKINAKGREQEPSRLLRCLRLLPDFGCWCARSWTVRSGLGRGGPAVEACLAARAAACSRGRLKEALVPRSSGARGGRFQGGTFGGRFGPLAPRERFDRPWAQDTRPGGGGCVAWTGEPGPRRRGTGGCRALLLSWWLAGGLGAPRERTCGECCLGGTFGGRFGPRPPTRVSDLADPRFGMRGLVVAAARPGRLSLPFFGEPRRAAALWWHGGGWRGPFDQRTGCGPPVIPYCGAARLGRRLAP
ncbi:hypothetical protein NDU88_002989 [Pleurodeles waltl]|uniref:Uncharacterized protein n=1 Tax=Pleurodeles waltl TaxID=8319 RepID=A0AAV7TPV9_PLEWA|nr:hypothetical protein NDU88_002989 [Pleurodeles waltl]